MRWNEALEGYWLAKRRNFSEYTILDYSRTFDQFGRWIDNDDVAQITPQEVNAYLESLHDRGLAPKTVLNAWIAFSSFWTWAQHELDLPHIIADHVDRPKSRRRMTEPYTKDEVQRLVSAAKYMRAWAPKLGHHVDAGRPTALRDCAIMVLLVATGIRSSELCALTIGDYDRKRGKIHIRHGKGDKQRIVYIGETARRYLWRYLLTREYQPDAAPLFTTVNNLVMDRDSLGNMIRRAGKRAGVERAGAHRFRHTFAINFLRNGGNLFELQEILGHEKLDTVRIYARLAEADIESAQQRHNVADAWRL